LNTSGSKVQGNNNVVYSDINTCALVWLV
jgi:hypothetical protein